MKLYRVTWSIDIDADGPNSAAIEAQETMRNTHVNWTFEVSECTDTGAGPYKKVDLDEDFLP